jgi:hypothetical protein
LNTVLVLQAFFLGCLFCFSLNLSDHFGFYFEFNKRDQPESSPDNSSPSTQHLDKQARLSAFGSPLISESVTSNTVSTDQVLSTAVQRETILHLSEVVCATLKNQEFIDSIIPFFLDTVLVLQAFFLGCLFCFSLNLSDHFGFYFEFPKELMHLCCAGWFLDEVAYIGINLKVVLTIHRLLRNILINKRGFLLLVHP